MDKRTHITAFYHFFPIPAEQVEAKRIEIFERSPEIKGLIILATEGCNGTVSGSTASIEHFKDELRSIFGQPNIVFKDSFADKIPFNRLKINIRTEIVESGFEELKPNGPHNHLAPAEWNRVMEEEDVIVLDTRNEYETEIGMFSGAIDPKIKKFNQFPDFIERANLPKDKKILMYCTGGIRCEKAILEMNKFGYENVYQLDGGILRYLAEFPNSKFEGECFVFDWRVSVDQNLSPTVKYRLCPHCGDPGVERINCKQCGNEAVVCHRCLSKEQGKTCSKNCAHHHKIGTKPKVSTSQCCV